MSFFPLDYDANAFEVDREYKYEGDGVGVKRTHAKVV
jgi:glutamine cyclotransferase